MKRSLLHIIFLLDQSKQKTTSANIDIFTIQGENASKTYFKLRVRWPNTMSEMY